MTTVNPGSPGRQRSEDAAATALIGTGQGSDLAEAYLATHQGPHGDAPAADSVLTAPMDGSGRSVAPALVAAHARVGEQRSTGDTRVAVYAAEDSSGFGPAIQIVTDQGAMVMD
nr:hypothetical protein [Actinomycetota bacterium]